MFNKPEDVDQNIVEQRKGVYREELALWNNHLEGRTFIAGSNFSFADVLLFPSIATAARQGVNLAEKYQNLHAYYEAHKTRPSIVATTPPHWATSEGANIASDI